MQTLLDELKQVLKQDARLVIEGKLAKNKVVELALKLDKDLLKLLLSSEKLKKRFFTDVDGTMVFDKHLFQRFVANKQFLPDSYTAFKNKIGLSDNGEDYLKEKNDVSLIWPYKDCVLEGGQTKEDAKRNEIFWNETLAPDQIDRLLDPKVLTHFKKFDSDGVHRITEFSKKDNLIIKGNNLLALHSLKKNYAGKVKLIYIDPPYNTGNDDFGYNDKFNHSAWLTFMKNRIETAYELLSKDGSLWINIDDDESHYLKVLTDEVFKRENFIRNIVWQKKYAASNDSKGIPDMHDHILVYQKSDSFERNLLPRTEKQNKYYKYDDGDGRGRWRSDNLLVRSYSEEYVFPITNPNTGEKFYPKEGSCWRASKKTIEKWIEENRIFFGKDGTGAPQLKRYLSEVQQGVVPNSWWTYEEADHNDAAKKEIEKVLDNKAFMTPKPEALMQRVIHIGSDEGDLVLDFFAGSGTTGAVAHKMGRQYILCEQMDYVESVTVERLQKVIEGEQGGISEEVDWKGGGSFVYAALMKYNAKYIDWIEEANSKKALQAIWEVMQDNAFLSYKVEPKVVNKEKDLFDELTLAEQKQFLIEVLDNNQLYVNYSEIDDEEFDIPEDVRKLSHKFYSL